MLICFGLAKFHFFFKPKRENREEDHQRPAHVHVMWQTKALFFLVGNLGCGMGECGKGGQGMGES